MPNRDSIDRQTLLTPIDIKAERSRSHAAGVTREENLPFLLAPTSGESDRGILLVHGLTASPQEMRSLGEYLAKHNSWVYGLRLPGHGTSPAQLADCLLEEWQAEVNRGLRFLRANCRTCLAIGMSTGGLLLLASSPVIRCDGLILLSPFLRIRHRLAPFAGLLKWFAPYQIRPLPPEQQPFYYEKRPLAAIEQLNRLRRRIRRLLRRVQTPTLVLIADADQTVDPQSARDLFALLGSRQKELHSYPTPAPHVLCSPDNPFLDDILKRVQQFIEDQS